MKPGRQLDQVIAREVMEHAVSQQKREVFESTPQGTRPVAHYSTDIAAAWEVAEKLGITLLPVETRAWFAMVGPKQRWSSPQEFTDYLNGGKFAGAGAGASESAPLAICIAALNAVEARKGRAAPEPKPELTH